MARANRYRAWPRGPKIDFRPHGDAPTRAGSAFELLRKRLFELPPGQRKVMDIPDLLAGCWNELAGARSEGMHAGKLQRMEYVRWEPPVLSFTIERHGAMGMGSTRAELQDWHIDLDRKTVECEISRSYRQLRPRAEAVKVEPIARELAECIIAGRTDKRLKWQNAETVRLLTSEIFPRSSGFKQTIAGRRERLRAAIEPLLAEAGWREIRRDVYSKSAGGVSAPRRSVTETQRSDPIH